MSCSFAPPVLQITGAAPGTVRMVDATLSALAKPLMSVVRAVWPRVERRYRERQAGELPIANFDFLEKGLDDTFGRLVQGRVDDDWWRGLLQWIDHVFVTPEFLRRPALQEWLAKHDTQADLKLLARSRLLGAYDDESIQSRVRQRYSDCTGEDERLAEGPIAVVIAILTAGYFASTDARLQPVIGLMQANAEETRNTLNLIVRSLAPDQHAVAAHSEVAEADLDKNLKSRSIGADRARDNVVSLAARLMAGDLRYATDTVKARVLFWAARLNTNDAAHLPKAREYLSQLQAIMPQYDVRIIEALIVAREGDHPLAIRMLQRVETPDGRAVLFFVLLQYRGRDAALDWFDGEPDHSNPNFFTGLGWCTIAFHLAHSGRWKESADLLENAELGITEWPDLLFIEGVVNAALLLPDDLRPNALRMELFHPWVRTINSIEATQRRAKADDCFRRAEILLKEVHPGRAQAAGEWRLWLRLSHPNQSVSEPARAEVREGMKDGRRAVDLIPFVCGFNIDFDEAPLNRFLAQRRRAAGVEGREVLAEFLLAELKMLPRDRAEYLEREETRLTEVITKSTVVGKRIEALIADRQSTRARQLLDERKADLADIDTESIEVMIAAQEGIDPRPRLEALYEESRLLTHLHNLVNHLGATRDWIALAPRVRELFERERTVENALRVIDVMRRMPSGSDEEIISFSDGISDLIATHDELASVRAWALFSTGRWKDAKEINDRLISVRHGSSDVSLDINLAIQIGDWERFATIVDREWQYRTSLEAATLLRLASLAAEVDATANRAVELATLAATKKADDPKVLISAYALFVQLGRDNDANPEWIGRAASLSTENSGPVWQVDMRTLIEEMVPAHRAKEQQILKALTHGELPLSAAAHALNIPLSRMLIDIPSRSTAEQDARRWTILPVLAGGRPPTEIHKQMSIGLDMTSIMILAFLGKLRDTLSYFRQVVLAPDTMVDLLQERRRVRFHQPSLVRDAEEISSLITSGRISVGAKGPSPPEWLVREVGRDLADLLHAARASSGLVVRPRPIPKLGSYLTENADLRHYEQYVISTLEFAAACHREGLIANDAWQHGRKYLEGHDCASTGPDPVLSTGRSIFLDSLALNYLKKSGLLIALCTSGIALTVHSDVPTEMSQLIAANREGEHLSSKLDQIRTELGDALLEGKAVFLKRTSSYGEAATMDELYEGSPVILNLVRSASQAETICVDDRALNRHGFVLDKMGRKVPITCSIDILCNVCPPEEYRSALHNLRRAGFALMPLDADELESRVRAAGVDNNGRLSENAELRTLRQSLMRLRSIDMLQPEFEGVFVGMLQMASILTLRKIWADTNIAIEEAVRISDWILENIYPSPIDWVSRRVFRKRHCCERIWPAYQSPA